MIGNPPSASLILQHSNFSAHETSREARLLVCVTSGSVLKCPAIFSPQRIESRIPYEVRPQRSFFDVTNHSSSSQKKGGRETAKRLQVRSGEANVRRILEFLISSIDIWRHQFILCSSEEELPKGIGKQGQGDLRGKNAVSPRCPRDAAATTFFRSSGVAIQRAERIVFLAFYHIKLFIVNILHKYLRLCNKSKKG